MKMSEADRVSKENIEKRNKAEIKKLEAQSKIQTTASKYLNTQKSWEKLDKKIPHIQKLADQVEDASKKLVESLNELNEALIEAYHTAPRVDVSSVAASPLGASKVWYHLKIHLMKDGLKNLGTVHNLHALKGFKQNITDGLLWLVKLKEGDHLYGTAAERAKQLAAKRQSGQ